MEKGVQTALDFILAPRPEYDAKRLNDAMKVWSYELPLVKKHKQHTLQWKT